MDEHKRQIKLGLLKELLNMSKDSQKASLGKPKGISMMSVSISKKPDDESMEDPKEESMESKHEEGMEEMTEDEPTSSIEPSYPGHIEGEDEAKCEDESMEDPKEEASESPEEEAKEDSSEEDEHMLPEPKVPADVLELVKHMLLAKKGK